MLLTENTDAGLNTGFLKQMILSTDVYGNPEVLIICSFFAGYCSSFML